MACLPAPDLTELAETAVAFANTDGGAVVIGLDGDGAYCGPVAQDAVEHALDALAEHCIPGIETGLASIDTSGGPALVVRVARSPQVHAVQDGRVYVRTCHENRLLDGAEIRHLVSARELGDFEAEVVPGATPADLDPELLADYLLRRAQRLGGRVRGNAPDLLIRAGAITPDYGVTVAGILLFGREPSRWLPDGGAVFRRYLGAASGEYGGRPAVERHFDGPLVALVEALSDAIREQMRQPAGDAPAEDLPSGAVREALINAVSHRDYRLRGDRIVVSLFTDRLEVTSPGGLPGFLTTRSMDDGHYCRNPRLTWGLYQWGYAEASGSGVGRMNALCDAHTLPRPRFEAGEYAVTVRLMKAPAAHGNGQGTPGANGDAHDLNPRQQRALDFAAQNGSITLRELQTIYRDFRPAVLHQDLTRLVDCGRLRKVGSRLSPYYILT
ncbi:MAG TPA: ATP-binding protein [Aggregatilinea sp.]|uniref:ATP-binding protein n=1 Tax=Aggregatilinea sp. TaxID=2806333 RepID=UPI002BDBB759|nr:ATP-binding protein [Aggregatilinea sp.]HML24881.1 ATP-binding protein [Aggregatilinea sp.]